MFPAPGMTALPESNLPLLKFRRVNLNMSPTTLFKGVWTFTLAACCQFFPSLQEAQQQVGRMSDGPCRVRNSSPGPTPLLTQIGTPASLTFQSISLKASISPFHFTSHAKHQSLHKDPEVRCSSHSVSVPKFLPSGHRDPCTPSLKLSIRGPRMSWQAKLLKESQPPPPCASIENPDVPLFRLQTCQEVAC